MATAAAAAANADADLEWKDTMGMTQHAFFGSFLRGLRNGALFFALFLAYILIYVCQVATEMLHLRTVGRFVVDTFWPWLCGSALGRSAGRVSRTIGRILCLLAYPWIAFFVTFCFGVS